MKKMAPPKVQRFPAAKQRLLDRLLEKNAAGTLSPKEKTTLDGLVAEAEQLMVHNARRLAEFARAEGSAPPADAVPVTVWVQPGAERP